MSARPQQNEFAPYFGQYINLVPDGSIIGLLTDHLSETVTLLGQLTEEQADYRYAEGKWSIKEVLGHITDNERIWSYRMLRIARGDQYNCVSYDENQFVAEAAFNLQPISSLIEEFTLVRRSTILLLKGLKEEAWYRKGTLYDTKLTVNAAAYVIAGHEKHHRNILESRYGLGRS
ncbi:DinB family protein [Paenibacillus solisilvae]|uniref:DinB family protein n=1 Tax=Paenibacillus solisilvae TaxID=2486751 RepID=A0ABW0W839_9BACL